MEKNKINNEAGITLIALVIVIIILLILAGISISMLTGENGLITKATQAATETDIAETRERIDLELSAIQAGNLGKYSNEDVITAVKKVLGEDINIEAFTTVQCPLNTTAGKALELWFEKYKDVVTSYSTFEIDLFHDWSRVDLTNEGYCCFAMVRI